MRLVARLVAAACLIGGGASAASVPTQGINALVDRDAAQIAADGLAIWKLAEPGFKEMKSSALLQARLKGAGFKVTEGVAGMPTAFVASYRNGPGPVIAILAEFDALPGISQIASATDKTPVAGALAGHACGHNLLGAGGVGAAIAARRWMEANGVRGEVRVYGAPAEEGGDGKAYMVRAGLFDDVDAVLHWHPADRNTVINVPTLANIKTDFHFHGVSAHAAAAPERGRSALEGVELMDVAVAFMRQHTPDGTRIHSIVVDGGRAPNVVPAFASSTYYVRHVDAGVVQDLQDRLQKAAQGAAIATGTTVDWAIQGGVYSTLMNDTLNDLLYANMAPEVAGMRWTPAETAYAQALGKGFGVKAADAPPNELAPRAPIAPFTPASSDVGDISQIVPTAGFTLHAWPAGVPAHSWASAGASGADIGTDATVTAAKILAASAIQLLQSPEVLAKAKAELVQRRGADFSYRALFGDRAPPLDYTDALMRQ